MPDEGHLRVILLEDMVITPPLTRGIAVSGVARHSLHRPRLTPCASLGFAHKLAVKSLGLKSPQKFRDSH